MNVVFSRQGSDSAAKSLHVEQYQQHLLGQHQGRSSLLPTRTFDEQIVILVYSICTTFSPTKQQDNFSH